MNPAQSNSWPSYFFGTLISCLLVVGVGLSLDSGIVDDVLGFPGRTLAAVDNWFGYDQPKVVGQTASMLIGPVDDVPNLSDKLESTHQMLSSLNLSYQQAASETVLIGLKWDDLTVAETNVALEGLINGLSNAGKTELLSKQWGWAELDAIAAKSNQARSNLITAKSIINTSGMQQIAYDQVKTAAKTLESVLYIVGEPADAISKPTLFGKYRLMTDRVAQIDELVTELDTLLKNGKLESLAEIRKKVQAINQIKALGFGEDRTPMALALNMLAVVRANRMQMAYDFGQGFSVSWMDADPLGVRILSVNPSSLTRQDIGTKYYLPFEIQKEDVLESDRDITIDFDAEKGQLYIDTTVTVAAGDAKIVGVKIADLWPTEQVATPIERIGRYREKNRSIASSSIVLGTQVKLDDLWHYREVALLAIGVGLVTAGVSGLIFVSAPGQSKNPGGKKSLYEFNILAPQISTSDM